MVVIEVSIEDISKLMGFKKPLTPDELDMHVSFAISEVDSEPEDPDEYGHTKIAIEIKTSNRPDLWSAEGIARVVRGGLDQPGLPPLETKPSGYQIEVDPELIDIRPYIGAAIVRGLKLDNFLIKQLIQIQDKVDFSYGRKRKRTSIGIYNANMLQSPIHYKLVDRNFKFIPLQFESELTINEIFELHPKGIEYRHILEPFEKVPILLGSNGLVLSLPPIINSNDVGRVTLDTTDVLIETTGTNLEAVMVSLGVVVQALRDRGGLVESVEIKYPDNYLIGREITPETDLITIKIDPLDINNYLGTDFSTEKIIDLLKKRRNNATKLKDKILVEAPPWRKDILHWVDLSEDIAIAAGYNEFEPTKGKVVTAGKLDPSSEDDNMIRKILLGLQLIEVLNYTLTNPEIIMTKVRRHISWLESNCIEITNPITSTFSVVRSDLIPGLLNFISKNTHVEYPHKIFETGECVIKNEGKIITTSNVAVLLAGAFETFETILSIFDSFFRLLNTEYELKMGTSKFFIEGRSADIYIDDIYVGSIGEVHPEVITNFGIEVAIVAFEIELSALNNLRFRRMLTNQN